MASGAAVDVEGEWKEKGSKCPGSPLSMAIGFSPSTAIGSPRRRPSFLPTGGRGFSPRPGGMSDRRGGAEPGGRGAAAMVALSPSVQGRHPFAGGRLCEPVAVLSVGDQDVGVVQQPFDGRGRQGLGHQLVKPGWVDV